MRTTRWVTQSAVLGTALALISGCGTEQEVAAAPEPVTLTVGTFGSATFKALYAEYERMHPGVTIKETAGMQEPEYYAALQKGLKSGRVADIQLIEVARIADVTSTQGEKWVDLRTLGAESLEKQFYAWKWADATTKDGKVLGLGTDVGPQAICYRKDLFAKAGLPVDREVLGKQWATWEGFLALGRQYAADGPAGSAFIDSAASIFNAASGQGETKFYDASGNVAHATNPSVKRAWDLATEASATGVTAKISQWSEPWNKGFVDGAFATVACPAWMLGIVKGNAGAGGAGKWDIATMPGGGGNWGGSYLAIPAASKNREAAYDLLSWMSSAEQQTKMWIRGQSFPSNSSAAAHPAVASARDAFFSGAPIGKLFGDSATKLVVQPKGPLDGKIGEAYSAALTSVEQQGVAPSKAHAAALEAAG